MIEIIWKQIKSLVKFECKGIKVDEKELKKKVTQKNLAQRVSAIELEFATQETQRVQNGMGNQKKH